MGGLRPRHPVPLLPAAPPDPEPLPSTCHARACELRRERTLSLLPTSLPTSIPLSRHVRLTSSGEVTELSVWPDRRGWTRGPGPGGETAVKRGLGLLFVVILPLIGLVGPGAVAGPRSTGSTGLHLSVATGGGDGTVGVAATRAMRQGYLVPDQAAYDRAKAAARRTSAFVRARHPPRRLRPSPRSPSRAWRTPASRRRTRPGRSVPPGTSRR